MTESKRANSQGIATVDRGLAATAARGASFTSTQALLNKIATIGAMWVIALRLTPDEFGMAALTLAVGVFLVILPPLTIGDVLVTHRRRFALVAPAATSIALSIGGATTILIAIVAPLIAMFYSNYPAGILTGLVWVVALRPIGDGLCPLPLARLRLDFRYSSIAIIDGVVQLCATITTVVLAFLSFGALALVLPQVVAVFAKAILYRSAVRKQSNPQAELATRPVASWIRDRVRRRLWREFLLAAMAQYVHNIVVLLPVLVLGYFASEEQTGLYAFAFMLSAQANGLIASQLGMVLQPIFGRFSHDMTRQVGAFVRVVRTIGAVAVPVTLLQAALAAPLFYLVFESKWDAAIQVFAVLSILEGFYFATAPTMALLRAQGRFATYFLWQASQFIVSLIAFSFAASSYGAIGVAVCAACIWAVSLPIAVWICMGGSGSSIWLATRIFLAPLSTAAPIAIAVWVGLEVAQPLTQTGNIIALVVVGPIALVCALLATRISQPSAYSDLKPMVLKVLGIVRRLVSK